MNSVSETGFVYVLTNDLMPGVVKVGLTSWLPEDRAKGLYKTGVPVPFEVAYRAMTSWPDAVERRAHEWLDDNRVSKRREFFRVPVEKAIEAVRLAAIDVAGIASWKASTPHILSSGDRLGLNLEKGQLFVLVYFSNIFAQSADILDLWEVKSHGDVLEIFVTDSGTQVAGFSDGDPGATTDPLPYLNRAKTASNGMIYGRERLVPGERLVWLPTKERAEEQPSAVFEAGNYCQIIGRTWSPKATPYGLPVLLNDFEQEESWPALIKAVNEARRLPRPRHWAPRDNRGSEWLEIGSKPLRPEDWLPQLNLRPSKSKTRSTPPPPEE